MLVLYIILGVLGLLLLALFIPVFAHIRYDGELLVSLRLLGIPITLLPSDETKKPAKKPKPASGKKPSKVKELKKELSDSFHRDGLSATLHYLKSIAAIAAKAVGGLLRAMTVDKLQLELLITAADPSKAAIRYGQVCGVLYPALSTMEQRVKVRRRQLRVEPNFLAEQNAAYVDVRLHLWLYRAVGTACVLLFRYIALTIQDSNDHKEVTKNG